VVLVVVALVGLAAVGLWALSRREPHVAGLTVTGTIEARDVDLSPKTTSRVAAIRVEEGSRVRRGELVIQLDDAELVADVARLEAGVRVAQAAETTGGLGRRDRRGPVQVKRAEAVLADLSRRTAERSAARQVVAQTDARSDLEAGRAQEIEQARAPSPRPSDAAGRSELERLAAYDRDPEATRSALAGFEVARMERTAREQLALVRRPRSERRRRRRAEAAGAERPRLAEAGPHRSGRGRAPRCGRPVSASL
jgi:HlyD family secretion protein